MIAGDTAALDAAGLNLQAVFALDALPAEVVAGLRRRFDPDHPYRQLILIGHAGRTLWESVRASGIASADPIDEFSVRTVERWFARRFAGRRHEIVYPGDQAPNLQTLGRLVGWHHPSPLMLGINARWGTWFAYRVAMLADTDLDPTPPIPGESPCDGCADKPCLAACPGGALDNGTLALDECVAHRKQPGSSCRTTCLARAACPVGAEYRYPDALIRHAYSISMRMIERGG